MKHPGTIATRQTTPHPFYNLDRGWIPAGELQIGDSLLGHTGKTHPMQDILDTGEYETVYNLRIADWYTYFVGAEERDLSIWAHNAYDVQNMVREGDDVIIVSKSEARKQAVPLSGGRQQGIDRAWELELQLITKTGKGTAKLSETQIKQIQDMAHYLTTGENIGGFSASQLSQIESGLGYRAINFTGYHINMVETHPQWQADPRNIALLEQGSGNSHMTLGLPGGTKVHQPGSDLIDLQAMLYALNFWEELCL